MWSHDLTVKQVWAWLFAPDGRVMVLLDPHTGVAILPGVGELGPLLKAVGKAVPAWTAGCPGSSPPWLEQKWALTDIAPARPDPATGLPPGPP